MVVRRGADAAEAENDVIRIEAAAQGRGQPFRIVTEVLRPGEAQPPLGEGRDRERKMLVLPLTDQDFVADDVGAEQSYAAFLAQRWSSSRPPICWPLMKTCGTVPRPVIAPTT